MEETTSFRVVSKNTGAHVCGPYDTKDEADRECERLNREARQGRTAPSDAHPKGQPLSLRGEPIIHRGQPQEYEVKTEGGVIL